MIFLWTCTEAPAITWSRRALCVCVCALSRAFCPCGLQACTSIGNGFSSLAKAVSAQICDAMGRRVFRACSFAGSGRFRSDQSSIGRRYLLKRFLPPLAEQSWLKRLVTPSRSLPLRIQGCSAILELGFQRRGWAPFSYMRLHAWASQLKAQRCCWCACSGSRPSLQHTCAL